MVDLVDFSKHHPLQDTSVEDVIEWLRAHEAEGNIHKLSVVFETKSGKTFSNSINLKNKDYVYFLMQELMEHFRSD